MSQAPAAADTQVWTSTPSPGAAVVMLAVAQVADGALAQRQRRSRSRCPSGSPDGMSTPASSPASSSGVAPSASTAVPARGEGDRRRRRRRRRTRGPEALGVQPLGDAALGPVRLERVEHPGRARRPRSRARPGRAPARRASAASSMPSVSVCRSTSRIRPSRGQRAQLGAEDDVVRRSARSARRRRRRARRGVLRSMPITGVMPLPAVTNRTLAGPPAGRTKSPAAWSSCTSVPGRARRTRWLLTLPSGIALTVIAMQPSAAVGGEVSE